jgi:hypothetical protein
VYRRELLLNVKRWAIEDYVEIAPHVTAEDLQSFYRRLLSRCRFIS